MATTTQILYNSPALHSLKREQLVKLCKTHSLKANGKNVELIERLKTHALELGQKTFLNPATVHSQNQQKENMQDGFTVQLPRPSEQWEIVMEDIQEVPEPLGTISSKGTLTSMRGGAEEFGSKTSNVSSSIRALATSLGIKRTSDKANASLNKHAVPFEALPPADSLPQSESVPLSTPDVEALKEAARTAAEYGDGDTSMTAPVPGSPSRPGAPAPENARLSMGQGPTTTIRLINSSSRTALEAPGTPVLPTFQTNFDLIMGSPNPVATPGQVVSVWPASPGGPPERLYPAIPFEDLLPAKASSRAPEGDIDMPGGLGKSATHTRPATPAKKSQQSLSTGTPKPADASDMFSPMRPTARSADTAHADSDKLGIPRREPFLFGSPLPRNSLSNQQFSDAAQSLVEEMQRRLAEQSKGMVPEQKPPVGAVAPIFELIGRGQGPGPQGSPDRFAKAHEAQFRKMDSIANHYAAKRPGAPGAQPASRKRKSEVLALGPAPGANRKSSAAGARVISAGARKRMVVPGGFGTDDDEEEVAEVEDQGDRRSSKRVRVSEVDGVHHGKRVSIVPSAGALQEGFGVDEEVKKQKEQEAIRRRLEANKARRRSSRGRVSVGGKVAPAKTKPPRFGFFASAKTLVKNVWNMGGGPATASKPAPVASSSIPLAKPTQTAALTKPAANAQMQPAVQNPSVRSTASTARKSSVSTSTKLQKPRPDSQVVSSQSNEPLRSSRSNTAQTRAPIPSFASPAAGTASSRTSASTTASKIPSRPGSIAGASSLGMRTSLVTKSQGAASSVGTRHSLATASSTGTSSSTRSSASSAQRMRERDGMPAARSRTSSLLAPTASSLARAVAKPDSGAAGRPPPLPAVAEQPPRRAPRKSVATTTKATLHALTNSPRSPHSPRPTKIFAQPLTPDTFASPAALSSQTRYASLGAAATALASPSRIPTAVPPRPKGLIAKKPRISRTRVVAKAGVQREPAGPSALAPASRVRSSVGARKSLGGVKTGRASAGGEAARIAAKKRVRQSEYARRRSRASGRASMGGDEAMDVDV